MAVQWALLRGMYKAATPVEAEVHCSKTGPFGRFFGLIP